MKRKLLFAAALFASVLGGGSSLFAQTYAELQTAINKVKNNLGFEDGEYAPYNAYDALAEAEQIEESATAEAISAAITKLEAVTANQGEENAIYDGSFKGGEYYASASSSNNIQPLGWYRSNEMSTNEGYWLRYVSTPETGNNPGLSATTTGHGLMAKGNIYYGYDKGKYSMPLKENTYYTVSFKTGGWGRKDGPHKIVIVDPSGNEKTILNEFTVTDGSANANVDSWKTIEVVFKTSDKGNYVLGIVSTITGENQIVYGDFELKKTVLTEKFSDLQEKIAEIESNLGFDKGEYAPYNVYATLAAAKAIPPTDEEAIATTMSELETLANTEEVNAVFDGTFATANNGSAPAGWSTNGVTLGGGSQPRTMKDDDRLSGFNSTNSAFMIRFEGLNGAADENSQYYYGNTEGYTMPLKADTYYTISLDFANWMSSAVEQPLTLQVSGPDDYTAEQTESTASNPAANGGATPENITLNFKTGQAGNYVITVKLPEGGSQNQNVVISNITLYRTTATVEVTDAGYATYVAPIAIEFKEDEAFVVANVEGGTTAILESVSAVPAGTAVIIKGEGPHKFTPVETAEEPESNLLKAATANIIETEGLYVLANLTQGIGFYALEAGVKIPAGKAYLDATDFGIEIKFIGFDSDTATAIKGVETAAEDAVIYNIAGQRVANPTKGGIYIVNGKKVLVK